MPKTIFIMSPFLYVFFYYSYANIGLKVISFISKMIYLAPEINYEFFYRISIKKTI